MRTVARTIVAPGSTPCPALYGAQLPEPDYVEISRLMCTEVYDLDPDQTSWTARRSADTPKTVGSGLAVSSLVLSFMPIINNLTAAGAFVGLVLGFIRSSSRPLPPPAPVVQEPPAPTVADFSVALIVTDKQCFGSAGCLLTVTPEVSYIGTQAEIPGASITYTVAGDDSGEVIQTIELSDGGQYSAMPLMLSTANSEVVTTATVTAVR